LASNTTERDFGALVIASPQIHPRLVPAASDRLKNALAAGGREMKVRCRLHQSARIVSFHGRDDIGERAPRNDAQRHGAAGIGSHLESDPRPSGHVPELTPVSHRDGPAEFTSLALRRQTPSKAQHGIGNQSPVMGARLLSGSYAAYAN
jgi:hypothetical protein